MSHPLYTFPMEIRNGEPLPCFISQTVSRCHFLGLFSVRIFDSFLPGGLDSTVSDSNAGDPGSIPGSGRSSGEGNGNPLQYFCLENPMDGGAWWATVHVVAKSWTRLSNFTFFHLHFGAFLLFVILCYFVHILLIVLFKMVLRHNT